MLSPIIGKRPRHRQFEYKYRYYKPSPQKPGERIEFRRKTRRGTGGSILLYALMLFLILWVIVSL